MSDTPRTDFVAHATGDSEWDRSINRFGRMQSHAQILERELAEAIEKERERCALIVERVSIPYENTSSEAAAAIRKGE